MSAQRAWWFDGSDAGMDRAIAAARETFRYFWRELSWERRRIVPAFDSMWVKATFTQRDRTEHMWIDDVDFDGEHITGTLLNEPHALTNVSEGDTVRVSFPDRLSDWMLVSDDAVRGSFTVNVTRAAMSPDERAAHDEAWGLPFGDPGSVSLVHDPDEPERDHPMAVAMLPKLDAFLAEDPSRLHATDERGWTLLHTEALAGNAVVVERLLQRGAAPNVRTANGATALALARALGWQRVSELLTAAGAS